MKEKLKSAVLQEMIKPARLKNGALINYALRAGISNLWEHPRLAGISHHALLVSVGRPEGRGFNPAAKRLPTISSSRAPRSPAGAGLREVREGVKNQKRR